MSLGEWIDKPQCTPSNGILFSDKKEQALKPSNTWMNATCLLLSRRSWSERITYCLIPFRWPFGNGKNIEMINRQVVGKGCRRKFEKVSHRLLFLVSEHFLDNTILVDKEQHAFNKIYRTLHHKEWTLGMYAKSKKKYLWGWHIWVGNGEYEEAILLC